MSKTARSSKEKKMFDFVRCQRADGSHYGTGGRCQKGREVDPIQKATKIVSKGLGNNDPRGVAMGQKEGLGILGRGAYGTVYDVGGGVVIKAGKIKQKELDIMEELNGIQGVPRVIAQNTDGYSTMVAMTKSPGDTIANLEMKDENLFGEGMDAALSIVGEMHIRGIAHNDLHQGNIMYDPESRSASVIDYGMATRNPHDALEEAANLFMRIQNRTNHSNIDDYENIDAFLSSYKRVAGSTDDFLKSDKSAERTQDILDDIWGKVI